MAAPKKSKPKTMDVAPPDSTLPNNSSRPLIVGNRSTMPDPMVVASPDKDEVEPTTSPLLAEHVRQVQPLVSDGETTDKGQLSVSAPAETSPESPQVKPGAVLTAETKNGETKPLTEVSPQTSEKAAQNDETMSDAEKNPTPKADKDSEEDSVSSDKDAQAPATEEKTGKAEAEKAAEAERAEQMKGLIDEKTYFVPIHQGSQGGNWALFLFLLVIVAVGAIAYMMMALNK